MPCNLSRIEWSKEGHRSYPLITRTPPSTALETVAERARNEAIHENSGLLHPSDTKRVRTLDEEITSMKEIVTKDPVSKIMEGLFAKNLHLKIFCFVLIILKISY